MVVPQEIDNTRTTELIEGIRQNLLEVKEPVETMRLIDTLQRLGIAYHFEKDINSLLENLSGGHSGEDLFTASLRFRLLRHNGHHISPGTNSTHQNTTCIISKHTILKKISISYY